MGEDATSYDVYSPPKTMTYLLLGPEGAYTDWHVDFAGSSVWYHVVKGKKVFMVAPDTAHNIGQFLKWSSSDDQSDFLGEQLEKCGRLVLNEGDTMFLPGGWFHAVSTPVDSVVVGGNYINPLRIQQLLTVRRIEQRLGIASQAEFPKFNMLMYYAAGDFIKRCQQSRVFEDGEVKSVFVSELEAKGLKSLNVYLESVVDEIESNISASKGRMTKEKRTLRENVDRCKEEIGLLTSFLMTELERLKKVYNWDNEAEETDQKILEEIISGDTSISRAWRRSRRASDDEHSRQKERERDNGNDGDDGDDGDGRDDRGPGGEWGLAAQVSSERAEESVEVILSGDDELGEPSSSVDQGLDMQSSFEVLLSTSDEDESEVTRTMVGTKSRVRLIVDTDEEVDLSVSGKHRTTDGDIITSNAVSGGSNDQKLPPVDDDKKVNPDGRYDGTNGTDDGTKDGAIEGAAGKLMEMIKDGALSPGSKVLLWKYKEYRELADLTEDGLIKITLGDGESKTFKSPTAFTRFMAEQKGFSRKGGNGWCELYYKEHRLADWRGVPPGAMPSMKPPQSATSLASGGVLRPPRSENGFLKRYKEKGDDPRQSRVEMLRAEALKKHSDLIANPLGSIKAVVKDSKVASKEDSPKISAKAAETLSGVEELTKIFKDLEKEENLLDQFNSGTLTLKDDGRLLKEKVQKNVDAFNAKAATISSLLSEKPSGTLTLSEELVRIRPNIIETISTLIKQVDSKKSGSGERGTEVSKRGRSDPLDDHGPPPKTSHAYHKSSRDASPRPMERKRHSSPRKSEGTRYNSDLDRHHSRGRDRHHDKEQYPKRDQRDHRHHRRLDKDHDRRERSYNDRCKKWRDSHRREDEASRRNERGRDRDRDRDRDRRSNRDRERLPVPMKRAGGDAERDRAGHSRPVPMVVDPRIAPMRKNERMEHTRYRDVRD